MTSRTHTPRDNCFWWCSLALFWHTQKHMYACHTADFRGGGAQSKSNISLHAIYVLMHTRMYVAHGLLLLHVHVHRQMCMTEIKGCIFLHCALKLLISCDVFELRYRQYSMQSTLYMTIRKSPWKKWHKETYFWIYKSKSGYIRDVKWTSSSGMNVHSVHHSHTMCTTIDSFGKSTIFLSQLVCFLRKYYLTALITCTIKRTNNKDILKWSITASRRRCRRTMQICSSCCIRCPNGFRSYLQSIKVKLL